MKNPCSQKNKKLADNINKIMAEKKIRHKIHHKLAFFYISKRESVNVEFRYDLF